MTVSIVAFTRDLRVHDNPALAAACLGADHTVPLFVLDDGILGGIPACPNRTAFLADSLRDLHAALSRSGGGLVVRRGDWVTEVVRAGVESGASVIHVADDVSGFAQDRLGRLERAADAARIGVQRHPGVTVVPPGAVTPKGGGAYRVFTPYHRRWSEMPWRVVVDPPPRVTLPAALDPGGLALVDALAAGASTAPSLLAGGETSGRSRVATWSTQGLGSYPQIHDDLAADATSRLSAHLHFGCVSPTELATSLRARPGAAAFLRQLCWRDFYHQVLAARPDAGHVDYRSRGDRWNTDDDAIGAWKEGMTGFPLVDAAMRQLRQEGFMHNRARMVVASFLTKDLYVDWRVGAAHFMSHLVDGDVANNQLNWQWTAGTGTDTNPNRIFNPVVQSRRFDPTGAYIRRHLPELAGLDGDEIHWPDEVVRRGAGYPEPVVDHAEAIAAYRVATRGDGAGRVVGSLSVSRDVAR